MSQAGEQTRKQQGVAWMGDKEVTSEGDADGSPRKRNLAVLRGNCVTCSALVAALGVALASLGGG